MQKNEPLRNPAIAKELERALTQGAYQELFSLLARFSGLPGTRPNFALGWAFAHAIAAADKRGDKIVAELCAMSPERVPPQSSFEFLPVVGAFCLAAKFLAGGPPEATMAPLRLLAEDERHPIREGVRVALVEMIRSRGDEVIALLGAWTDGYLAASVAIEAVASRETLDGRKEGGEVLARLDEAFSLAEGAGRADRRSQGYRTLVKTLSVAPARVIDRFPEPTLAWLSSRASTGDVELRDALEQLARRARERGHGAPQLQELGQTLDASAPPRRDPRTYVGPTRQRGSKRR